MQQDAPAKSVGIDGYCADDAFALLMSMNSVSIMVVSIAVMIALSITAICVAYLNGLRRCLPVDDSTMDWDMSVLAPLRDPGFLLRATACVSRHCATDRRSSILRPSTVCWAVGAGGCVHVLAARLRLGTAKTQC